MQRYTKGFESTERPRTISLPKIKQESYKQTVNENKSSLFKSFNQQDLLTPDSNDAIEHWLLVQPEPNKRVQFANNINNNDETISRLNINKSESLSDINQHVHQSNLSPIHETQSENNNTNELLNKNGIHSTPIVKPKFYPSINNKALSISTVTSSSTAGSRTASFLPTTSSVDHRTTSIDNSSSIISSSIMKYRLSNLSLLEFNTSLSDIDKKKFNDIREHVPEEFEQLLPTLLKLGIIVWPKKFFDKKEQLTLKEIRQRQNLISIIEKDEQNSKRQHYLQNLYGNILPHDDILHKHHLLRENLSFHGQLSLLETYRDEIENLLTKKIPYWKSIPMKSIRTNFNDEINSLNHSLVIPATIRAKNKFFQAIVPRKTKSFSNIYSLTNDELFSLTFPDKIDNQWSRTILGKIIEQGMEILDQVRKLSQPSLLNQYDQCDLKDQAIVRKFKQWLFLWSTLYTEEK
ncbi:unnamed protein product [Rotaria sp. Silwood1]|nr:unnamed protein product [Rotaria sp. Silwood1]CAF1185843.1 unnamed protein product [Rotaria sp. Silwood1]CAF4974761.1 unnamed protein product [Rotaria sp. Silwood1]